MFEDDSGAFSDRSKKPPEKFKGKPLFAPQFGNGRTPSLPPAPQFPTPSSDVSFLRTQQAPAKRKRPRKTGLSAKLKRSVTSTLVDMLLVVSEICERFETLKRNPNLVFDYKVRDDGASLLIETNALFHIRIKPSLHATIPPEAPLDESEGLVRRPYTPNLSLELNNHHTISGLVSPSQANQRLSKAPLQVQINSIVQSMAQNAPTITEKVRDTAKLIHKQLAENARDLDDRIFNVELHEKGGVYTISTTYFDPAIPRAFRNQNSPWDVIVKPKVVDDVSAIKEIHPHIFVRKDNNKPQPVAAPSHKPDEAVQTAVQTIAHMMLEHATKVETARKNSAQMMREWSYPSGPQPV